MKPLRYNICIEPNFDDFSFAGSVRIQLHADLPVEHLVLDANELSFGSVRFAQGQLAHDCDFAIDETQQALTVQLPHKTSGEFELAIDYTGIINDQYKGLFRSQYHHDGQEKYFASTQFEASDARRAFPCFDRPDLKATYDIEFVIDAHLTGISNEAVLAEERLDDGRKRVQFRRTPPMSTYLVFFGIGEFEFIEDAASSQKSRDTEGHRGFSDRGFRDTKTEEVQGAPGRPRVRVATAPGKTEFGRYALDMARKTLGFGAEYLGIPYPLSKCDYIGIPDSMGAMENFGAIRHAEDVLLVYPGVTSTARETLIAKIVAHEGIHMWFGDLVSPAAWKYLWLNEAFATYFTYVIPHHFYPEWGVWDQFFVERMLSGLERDGLPSTLPIDLPNVDDPNADPAPTPSTAPIVYNKGAAVLRMLAAYLGEDAFRKALHDFMLEYQFDAATSTQFWATVARASGRPVENFAATWIHQPGHPLVTVTRVGAELHLAQRRFCYRDAAAEGVWVIPVDVLLMLDSGVTETRQIVFDSASCTFPIPAHTVAYKLNAGFTGFYRVQYADENWARLGELISTQQLDAVDSLNLLDDLFALVKAGVYTTQFYLDFIAAHCRTENRYLPLTNLARNLVRVYQANPQQRPQISEIGLPIFERALDHIGWEPRADEALVTTELRETLLWAGFFLGSTRVAAWAYPQFERYLQGETIHRDIIGTVLKIGAAVHCDASSHLWAVAADPERAEAERMMVLEALGNLPEQSQLEARLEKAMAELPHSLHPNLIQACARNSIGPDFMWDWLRAKLPHFETRTLPVVEGLIVGIIPLAGLGKMDEVRQVLAAFVARNPRASDSVRMALELLAVNQNLREA